MAGARPTRNAGAMDLKPVTLSHFFIWPRFKADDEDQFRAFFTQEFEKRLQLSAFVVQLSIVHLDMRYALKSTLFHLVVIGGCHLCKPLRKHKWDILCLTSTALHVATGRMYLFAQSQVCCVFVVFLVNLQLIDLRNSLTLLSIGAAAVYYADPSLAANAALGTLYGTIIAHITMILVRVSFEYTEQAAALHSYIGLQTAYADANHYAKSVSLVVLRHLEASPPAIGAATRALHKLSQKIHLVEVCLSSNGTHTLQSCR